MSGPVAMGGVFVGAGASIPPPGSIGTDDITNDSAVAGATCTDALNTLNASIAALTSTDIANASAVGGSTVSAALNTLLRTQFRGDILTTTYTFDTTDANLWCPGDNASAQEFTLPSAPATGSWTQGDTLLVHQKGAGQITVVAGGSTVIRNNLTNKTSAQYATLSLVYQGSNVWVCGGDRATS